MNNYEKYTNYVHKFNVTDSNFYLTNSASLVNLTGFRSLYAVSEQDAEAISQSGSYTQFKGTVWSPTLALDFDSEEAGWAARERLVSLGLGYEMWHTGNRGYHFEISRVCIPTHQLPQLDKAWVKINFPEADLSIYTHLHLFRLENTVHEITGNKKVLKVVSVIREPIYLNTVPELVQCFPVMEKCGNIAVSSIFLNPSVMTRTVPYKNGVRHDSLMKLAVSMRHLGESPEFIARWIYHVSLLSSEPIPQTELDNIVRFIEEI